MPPIMQGKCRQHLRGPRHQCLLPMSSRSSTKRQMYAYMPRVFFNTMILKVLTHCIGHCAIRRSTSPRNFGRSRSTTIYR